MKRTGGRPKRRKPEDEPERAESESWLSADRRSALTTEEHIRSARGGCVCSHFLFLFLQEERSREEENPPDVPDVAPVSDDPPPLLSENRQNMEEEPESEVKN